jgi:hypothetical protein
VTSYTQAIVEKLLPPADALLLIEGVCHPMLITQSGLYPAREIWTAIVVGERGSGRGNVAWVGKFPFDFRRLTATRSRYALPIFLHTPVERAWEGTRVWSWKVGAPVERHKERWFCYRGDSLTP